MKRLIMSMLAVVTMVFAGCEKLPTVEKMEAAASMVGKAAAYVANKTQIDAKTRAAVVEVMETVSKVVPAKDKSFTETWTPLADDVIAKLETEGKLNEAQAAIAKTAFAVVCKGMDYIFMVKYPKAREYDELVAAAVKGFSSGFLSVFKAATVSAGTKGADYDADAYDFLVMATTSR